MRRRKLLVLAQTQNASFLDKLDDDRQTFVRVYVSLFSMCCSLAVCKKYETIPPTICVQCSNLSLCPRFVSE